MRANFHLASDLEIEVEDRQVDSSVALRVITGVNYADQVRHVEREIVMHKSAARAIASAMMGCAAQID